MRDDEGGREDQFEFASGQSVAAPTGLLDGLQNAYDSPARIRGAMRMAVP
jgi:hypothetical protein